MICETVLLFGVWVRSAFIFWQMLYIFMDNSSAFIWAFQVCLPSLIGTTKSLVENKTDEKK